MVLAAGQVQSSQSSSLFLGLWLSPPLVHSLSVRLLHPHFCTIRIKPKWIMTASVCGFPQCQTRSHLYETLGSWMKHVGEDKLQVYVESLGLQQFQGDVRNQRLFLCRSVLRGFAQAMALPNPPNNCWSLLCSTTEKIFNLLPNNIQVRPTQTPDSRNAKSILSTFIILVSLS